MRHLLYCLLLLASPALAAQTTIHHCVAADGTPVFTDRSCAGMDATLVDTTDADGHAIGVERHARLPETGFCPASPQALQARVASAFGRDDANALAGLMLWHGYGGRAARAGLRRLRALVREPVLGVGYADFDAIAADGMDPGAATTLTIQLGSIGRRRVASFDVVPRSGCLWLQP